MRTARIARPVGAVLLLGSVPGCSENNELDPGTFTARLSGARTEALSGSAVAGVVFSAQGVSYTINMLDQGDEFVFLTVLCPGEEAPAPGNHPLGTTESDCSAGYRRTVDDPFTTIEQADAVSGSLVVRESERGVIAGSLDFTGPLVAGETRQGDLNGSASFDAAPIAAGGRVSRVPPLPLEGPVRSQTRLPIAGDRQAHLARTGGWSPRQTTDAWVAGFYNNVTISGGPAPIRAYMDELLPEVLEGRIEPGRDFDRAVGLEEVPGGYRAMNEREAIKVMVMP